MAKELEKAVWERDGQRIPVEVIKSVGGGDYVIRELREDDPLTIIVHGTDLRFGQAR
jgi:hypothetical protein